MTKQEFKRMSDLIALLFVYTKELRDQKRLSEEDAVKLENHLANAMSIIVEEYTKK